MRGVDRSCMEGVYLIASGGCCCGSGRHRQSVVKGNQWHFGFPATFICTGKCRHSCNTLAQRLLCSGLALMVVMWFKASQSCITMTVMCGLYVLATTNAACWLAPLR